MITFTERTTTTPGFHHWDISWGRGAWGGFWTNDTRPNCGVALPSLGKYFDTPTKDYQEATEYIRLVLGRFERLPLIHLPKHLRGLVRPSIGKLVDIFPAGGILLCKVLRAKYSHFSSETSAWDQVPRTTVYVPVNEVQLVTESAIAMLMAYR